MAFFSKTIKGDLSTRALAKIHQSYLSSNMTTITTITTTTTTIKPETTTESSFFNLFANFEDNVDEQSPDCNLHMPEWLNVWFVLLTVCLLIIMCSLLLIVSQVKQHRQRSLTQYQRFSGTPDYYSELFLDRSHIMVY